MRAAVVVGCDGYSSPNASLAGAVRDALAFWQWVCDPDGGGVTEDSARRLLLSPSDKGMAVPAGVTAGAADKASFEIALHEVVRDAGDERERLYVYFAGHGFSVDDDFTVQGAIAFADFDRNRTDNSIVVTDLLSELSFTGFAEQILVFDACRNIPFEGRLRAGRISRPFDRVPGVTEQFCALATTALNRTSDGTSAEDASFSGYLMRALAGDGTAKIWNEDANAYVVRWDQMFQYVTSALRTSVGDDRLPRQLGEHDVGDPVLAQFAADHFPAINVALQVHPDDVPSADLVVHDPPDEHKVTWTAPGPATVSLVPRDYIVVASAKGLDPERRRWPLSAYADSTVDITFVPHQSSRGGDDRGPRLPPGPTTFRAPDAAMAVSIGVADGTRLEALGAVAPEVARSTTVVARVTAPDGRDGPPVRLRVFPEQSDDVVLPVPAVDATARRFAERLELTVDDDGLVDVGGDTPAWPAPSSLLAMAWARPGFVPHRVLSPLPDARSEAVVVIASDITVLLDADVVVDPTQQPFGERGARRISVDGRELLVPNVATRALIVDLTGSSPFASPAPITSDPDLARRIDLGYRYAANGRLRIGLELIADATDGDALAASMSELSKRRLDGDAAGADDGALAELALDELSLAIGGDHPLLARWVVAPHSAVTIASIRTTK